MFDCKSNIGNEHGPLPLFREHPRDSEANLSDLRGASGYPVQGFALLDVFGVRLLVSVSTST